MSGLKQQILKIFREDYYLRNRVSPKHFYQFKDRVVGLVGEHQKTFVENLEVELRRMWSECDTQMILAVVEEVFNGDEK